MYTVDDLIEDIRIRGAIPNSQSLFTPARFVSLMTGEMQTLVVPQIMSVREDYFLTYEDQPITSSLLYDMPEDAIGSKLSNVYIVDSSGQENVKMVLGENRIYSLGANQFYLQNNQVRIGEGNTSQTLRMYYYRRANNLVPNIQAGQVTTVNALTNTLVLSNVPTAWTTGTLVSVIKGRPGFEAKYESTAIVSVSSPTIGLASVANIVVGDWIALTKQSPIPQLPVEAFPLLAQAVVVKCMEAMGDQNGMRSAEAKLQQIQGDMFTMLNPRVDGSPRKITSRNGIFGFNTVTRNSFSRRY